MATEGMETKVGGLRAIEMYYRGIREFESGDTTFVQSKTRLNTPGMGTLMPETYRKVAELSNQCISLFELELKQAIDTIKSLLEKEFYFRWLSVYMPLRYLETKSIQQKLMDVMDETGTDTNRLCFELPSELLLNGNSVHSTVIEQLRNRGFHFMLTDFGGINSPLMKLAYFPVDFVMLSQEMISYLNKDDRSLSAISSIVDFIEGMEADVIADGVSNLEQAEQLFKAKVRFGAGSLSGRYMTERYLRRKKAEADRNEKVEEKTEEPEADAESVDDMNPEENNVASEMNQEDMANSDEMMDQGEFGAEESAADEAGVDESLFDETSVDEIMAGIPAADDMDLQ
ncbi:EAL domain, c-di-GMP-specific phosphodiesterase class I (or its enzymatically inactive variant) [Eubacterium ruminantium]|nr:EAL domain, c-di-GMP-specific phosphodiesterase class I (or its enzymatically inactive variant) [Eubacterium ruminantium]